MFFRNVTFMRFPSNPAYIDAVHDALQEGLRECALKPVGPLELSSRGFVAPYGQDDDRLVVRIGDCEWFTIGGEDKILPGSAVNAAVAKKLAAIEAKEGRKPGGRTRKRVRDEVITDLLPNALVKPVRINAYLDNPRGLLVVDTASRRVAETVASEVRRALGSFPALPLNAEVSPRSVLTSWLAGEPLPYRVSLADTATLKDPVDHGPIVRFQNHDLAGAEIEQHLSAGKQATRLGLYHECGLSFTVDEDLVLRKVHYHDELVDALEAQDRDDLQAELDARFVLMSGAVAQVFDTLEDALKLSKARV